MKATGFVPLVAAVLTACGGGGGGGGSPSTCQSIGPNTDFASASGNVSNLEAAADQAMGTFATFNGNGSGGWITSEGNNFLAGSNAGLFLTPPGNLSTDQITVYTFVDVEESTLESATGSEIIVTPTPGDPATYHVSFVTSAPFNGVGLLVHSNAANGYLIFEICGAATVGE